MPPQPTRAPCTNALAALALATVALAAACGAPRAEGRLGWGPGELEAERRCQAGSPAACGELGRHLIADIGVQKDRERGLVLLEIACGQDDLPSCTALAAAYAQRLPHDKQTLARARDFATRACERRSAEACTEIGEVAFFEDRSNERAPSEAFRTGCRMGDARGCELFGLLASRNEVTRDRAAAEEAFAAGCSLGRRSSCHFLAMTRLRTPATRAAAVAMIVDNCTRHRHPASCAVAAMFGAPLISGQPDCGRAAPYADSACAAKDAAGCAVADACKLEETRGVGMAAAGVTPAPAARDALERLRVACDRNVPLACLYWADAQEPRAGAAVDPTVDPDRVRSAYVVACRSESDAASVACPRVAIGDLGVAESATEAERPLTILRQACERSSGEACCALAEEHRRGQWVGADAQKAVELRAKACGLGWQACCGQAPVAEAAEAAGASPPVATASAEPVPATKPEDRVILAKEIAPPTLLGQTRATQFWTPPLGDILSLERQLPDYLRQKVEPRRGETPLWKKAPSYKRQYVGILKSGRRVIYANFFCRATSADWLHQLVMVKDGGDCYFRLEYDVTSGRFSELQVNGEA